MNRLIKLLNNEAIEIVEYSNVNACFQTNEYPSDELFCVMRETFNPFDLFQEKLGLEEENKKLWERHNEEYNQICKTIEYLKLFDNNSTLIDHSIIKGALNILKGVDKK